VLERGHSDPSKVWFFRPDDRDVEAVLDAKLAQSLDVARPSSAKIEIDTLDDQAGPDSLDQKAAHKIFGGKSEHLLAIPQHNEHIDAAFGQQACLQIQRRQHARSRSGYRIATG